MTMVALEAAIDKCYPNLRARIDQGVQTSPTNKDNDKADNDRIQNDESAGNIIATPN